MGIAGEHESEDGHEQQQQGEKRDEAGESEHCREVAGGVVAVLLDDREHDARRRVTLLEAVGDAHHPLDRIHSGDTRMRSSIGSPSYPLRSTLNRVPASPGREHPLGTIVARPIEKGSPMDPHVKPEVEVRSSSRRRKTGVAFWEGGRVVVVVPERMSRTAKESFAEQLVKQLLRRSGRRHSSDDGLAARAGFLADQYLDGVRPSSIRWSARQQRRWGSCSLHSREIRIAARLQTVPEWVLDGVIVHELAHLLEAGHTPRFHELANRYPRQMEAHTYLDGFGHGLTTAGFPVSTEGDDQPVGEPEADGRRLRLALEVLPLRVVD